MPGTKDRWFKFLLLMPAVLWVLAFTVYPLVAAVRYSFSSYVMGRGIVGWVGVDNFTNVLTSADFWHSVLITLIYTVVAVGLEVIIGVALAWVIHLNMPGHKVFRAIITAPLFTMGVAVGYLGVTLFSSNGGLYAHLLAQIGIEVPWLSTATGGLSAAILLDVWRWTSFIFLITLAGLGGISEELYEAALLDTRNQWTVFRYVAMPLLKPVVSIALLLRLVECFKTFGLPYALTSGGPGTSTQLFSTMDYLTTIQFFDFGKGSAMGVTFLVLVSVVIVIFFRQMRRQIE
ncbi:MAG TPA: sugar ABC transporter permease [Gammaproteobacteria bacterium]|nr:sugar ABC transporter permease [Gammaproteobacteria bacterium]